MFVILETKEVCLKKCQKTSRERKKKLWFEFDSQNGMSESLFFVF